MTEWQKFIVALSQAWAWPLVTVISVWLLREAIKQLAGRLRSAKYGDFQAEFGIELAKAEVHAVAEAVTPPPSPVQPEEVTNFNDALEAAPSYAILTAWQGIEAELVALARSKDISGYRSHQLLRQLTNFEVIDGRTYELIEELRSLRNKVVHNALAKDEVTPEQAKRYGALAFDVLARLRSKREKD